MGSPEFLCQLGRIVARSAMRRVDLEFVEEILTSHKVTVDMIERLKTATEGRPWTLEQITAMGLVLSVVQSRREDYRARRDCAIVELAEELRPVSPATCSAAGDFTPLTPGTNEPVRGAMR